MSKQHLRFTPCFVVPGKNACGLIEQAVDARVHACAAKVSSAIAASNSV